MSTATAPEIVKEPELIAAEQARTALAVVEKGSPLPVFTGGEMAKALTAYRELQRALDQSMPDQIMELDGKPFRKKGYWRAIAVAFNLTVEPIEERSSVSGSFDDGRPNFGYVVTYRATAPNGRSTTGDGAVFAIEKARRFRCPHPEKPGSKRTLHFPAESCPDFDPAYQWRTLPAQATEHNIRSHAHTRAFNRAVSNLVGFGEVSAEEVDRDDHANGSPAPAPTERGNSAAGQDARSRVAPSGGETSGPHHSAGYATPDDGLLRIARVDRGTTRNKGLTKYTITMSTGEQYSTIKERLGELCQQLYQEGSPVYIGKDDIKVTQYGNDLMAIHRVDAKLVDDGAPLTDDDGGIPF